jgi:hypothetical protein
MIRSHEHYEALKNLAVALNVIDLKRYHDRSIPWLEAASRLALSGVIQLSADGEIVPAENVQCAPIWGEDLLLLFPPRNPAK